MALRRDPVGFARTALLPYLLPAILETSVRARRFVPDLLTGAASQLLQLDDASQREVAKGGFVKKRDWRRLQALCAERKESARDVSPCATTHSARGSQKLEGNLARARASSRKIRGAPFFSFFLSFKKDALLWTGG